MALPSSPPSHCFEPPTPGKAGTAHTQSQQRETRVVALLLTVGVGRMLLKCLFFLRRAILYCEERMTVMASVLTSWPQ